MTELRIDPQRVALVFLRIVLVLALLNGLLLGLNYYREDSQLEGLLEYFDFDIEGNVPTLYSAFAVGICSGLLALIARIEWHRTGGRRWYWLGLAILFFFLAIDEGTAIHEQLSDVLEEHMAAEGALYFLWVIPYGIATVALGLLYLRFVWQLPGVTRARFIEIGRAHV